MPATEVEIRNPTGLHTRPATAFVRLAKTFPCAVTVRKGEKSADAKSLVKLLLIGVSQGDRIELACEGPDEAEALAALTRFLDGLEE